MNESILWYLSFLSLVGLWWIIAWRSGPRVAIGVVALMATLVAAWCKLVIVGGMHFFVRDAAILTCLACYCIHPQATFPWRLGWLDLVALSWVILHGVSDGLNENWSWIHFGRSYVEWAAPYLAARLAFQDWDEVGELVSWGALAGGILGSVAMVEAVFAIHPWEWLFGFRPDENFGRESIRWGLYRPWGPTAHAIYFGFIQLLLLPWSGIAAAQVFRRERSPLWLASFILAMLGILASLSRGPILGALLAIGVILFFAYPKWRIALGVVAVLGLGMAFLMSDKLMEIADRSAESSTTARPGQMIEVDGIRVAYSGSKTRFVIFSLYRRAINVAGWTGYGSARTSVFPPQVPMGTDDRVTWEKVRFVDNCYVLMTLRFGWLGGILFFLLVVIAVYSWGRVAISYDPPAGANWLAAALIAAGFVMCTVWLAHDYKFLVFWLIGSASGPLTRLNESYR